MTDLFFGPVVWWNQFGAENFRAAPLQFGWVIAVVAGVLTYIFWSIIESTGKKASAIGGILLVGYFLSASAFWWDWRLNQNRQFWIFPIYGWVSGIILAAIAQPMLGHVRRGVSDSKGFSLLFVALLIAAVLYFAWPPLAYELNHPTDQYSYAWSQNWLFYLILIIGGVVLLRRLG